VVFLGGGNQSKYFTFKLMEITFSIYEFSPQDLFSLDELRSKIELWLCMQTGNSRYTRNCSSCHQTACLKATEGFQPP
jgi:hypothetical protein